MSLLLLSGGPRPVVVTGALGHWPALKLWQDMSYLEQLAGHRTVPVEVGRTYLEEGWGTQLMTLQSFLRQHVQGKVSGWKTSTCKGLRVVLGLRGLRINLCSVCGESGVDGQGWKNISNDTGEIGPVYIPLICIGYQSCKGLETPQHAGFLVPWYWSPT